MFTQGELVFMAALATTFLIALFWKRIKGYIQIQKLKRISKDISELKELESENSKKVAIAGIITALTVMRIVSHNVSIDKRPDGIKAVTGLILSYISIQLNGSNPENKHALRLALRQKGFDPSIFAEGILNYVDKEHTRGMIERLKDQDDAEDLVEVLTQLYEKICNS